MNTDPTYNCPECDAVLEEEATCCPACKEDLFFCDYGNHYVFKAQYNIGASRCENCLRKDD